MAVALQIRDVPEPIRDALATRAAAEGLSLQAYLLALVVREAGLINNASLFPDPKPGGGVTEPVDTVALVRGLREERAARILRLLE